MLHVRGAEKWLLFLLHVLGAEKGLMNIVDVVLLTGDDKGWLEVGKVLLSWSWRRDFVRRSLES